MKRRPFLKRIAISTSTIFVAPNLGAKPSDEIKKNRIIKPNRLVKGDEVTLIAPGGPLTDDKIEKAVRNIEDLGLTAKLSKNLRAKRGHLAGTDNQRLDDLQFAFSDTKIKAIWCVRGGDGCNRLLPYINYKLIKKNPKPLIGFSDITALISAIYRKTGLVGFHAPIGAWDFTDFNKESLIATLFNGGKGHFIDGTNETQTIREGKVNGKLIGGNLSLLTALSGTAYENDFEGKIVFIEDVGEKPRRIDRMLTQLRQANNLKQAKGVILGEFVNCNSSKGDDSLTLIDTLKDRLYELNIPVLYNFPFGHDKNLCTFPVGIRAELDTTNKRVTFKENSTI